MTTIESLLDQLREACGYDHSESGSEEFVSALGHCIAEVMDAVDDSHAQGLCYNAIAALASRIEEYKKAIRART